MAARVGSQADGSIEPRTQKRVDAVSVIFGTVVVPLAAFAALDFFFSRTVSVIGAGLTCATSCWFLFSGEGSSEPSTTERVKRGAPASSGRPRDSKPVDLRPSGRPGPHDPDTPAPQPPTSRRTHRRARSADDALDLALAESRKALPAEIKKRLEKATTGAQIRALARFTYQKWQEFQGKAPQEVLENLFETYGLLYQMVQKINQDHSESEAILKGLSAAEGEAAEAAVRGSSLDSVKAAQGDLKKKAFSLDDSATDSLRDLRALIGGKIRELTTLIDSAEEMQRTEQASCRRALFSAGARGPELVLRSGLESANGALYGRRKKIDDDGNCLFSSVASALGLDKSGAEVRADVASEMQRLFEKEPGSDLTKAIQIEIEAFIRAEASADTFESVRPTGLPEGYWQVLVDRKKEGFDGGIDVMRYAYFLGEEAETRLFGGEPELLVMAHLYKAEILVHRPDMRMLYLSSDSGITYLGQAEAEARFRNNQGVHLLHIASSAHVECFQPLEQSGRAASSHAQTSADASESK